MNPVTTGDVRPSPIAGTWYPGNPETLAASIREMLAHAAPPAIPGRIIGLVAPHAGHRYSGGIAAHAFRLIQGLSFEQVVVVSPMHYPYDAAILTTSHHYYQTPLG
jgi:AmmeMemoRadiSam system protein B